MESKVALTKEDIMKSHLRGADKGVDNKMLQNAD